MPGQLTLEKLAKHLQGPLAPVYVLHGNEPLFIFETTDALNQTARAQGFEDREVLTALSGFNWENLLLAATGVSLFGKKKILQIHIPTGKLGIEGSAALQTHVQREFSDLITLIVLPYMDWAAKKTAWFKNILAHSTHLELNTPPLERLPQWISQRLQSQGQNAPTEALELIAHLVEGNLVGASQEIYKLGLLYPQGALTLDQVSQAVVAVSHYEEEQLRQAILEGNFLRCVRLIRGLRADGSKATFLLWILTQQARILARLRHAIDLQLPLSDVCQSLKLFGSRGQQYQTAAHRHSLANLQISLRHAAYLDRMVKGLEKGEAWDEMKRLCQRLCRTA